MAQKPVEYVVEGGGDDMGVFLLLAAAGVGALIAYKEGWLGGDPVQDPGHLEPLKPADPGHLEPLKPADPGHLEPLKPAPSPPLMKPLPYIGHGQCLKTGTVGLDGRLGGWAFQNQMDNPGDCKPVLPGYSQAFWGVWAGPKEGWVGHFVDTGKACGLKFENGLGACDMKSLPVSGWRNPPLGTKPPPGHISNPPGSPTYSALGYGQQDYEHGYNWIWDPPVPSKSAVQPGPHQASFFGTYNGTYGWQGTITDPSGICAKSFGCDVGSIPKPR